MLYRFRYDFRLLEHFGWRSSTSLVGCSRSKDWLDDLGLDTPVTYDDWYNMLKAFKAEKGAVAPMMLYFTGFNPKTYSVVVTTLPRHSLKLATL